MLPTPEMYAGVRMTTCVFAPPRRQTRGEAKLDALMDKYDADQSGELCVLCACSCLLCLRLFARALLVATVWKAWGVAPLASAVSACGGGLIFNLASQGLGAGVAYREPTRTPSDKHTHANTL
jgi:hypothetical protein